MDIYRYWILTVAAGFLFYVVLRLTGDPQIYEKAFSFLAVLVVISVIFTITGLRKKPYHRSKHS